MKKPGFITDYEFDEAQFTKKVMKPVTIQIKENDYLSIGNKIFISCDSVKNSFTFYMSSDIKIDKLYKDNEKINLDNKLNIPDDSDIVIPGYGFINVKKSCNIKINVNNVEIRTSMF